MVERNKRREIILFGYNFILGLTPLVSLPIQKLQTQKKHLREKMPF
jgi:hypothetical protein